MESVIEVNNLIHQFGERRAVDDLSFSVQPGEVVGLMGPNGAGKTTTVRLLNGLYSPAAGTLRVLGLNPAAQGAEVRRRCGTLTETPALYERLTARQNLAFFGVLAGMTDADIRQRTDALLRFFDLQERASDRTATFSKGMKQRLALARALFHRPQVVFLDEPTAGLDPEAAQQVHRLIASLRKQDGHSVLLCTHNLEEASRLCDRIAILSRGRLLACGSLDELRRLVLPGLWVQVDLFAPMDAHTFAVFGEMQGVLAVVPGENSLRLHIATESVVPLLVERLVEHRAKILRVQPEQVSLEEIYFKLQADQPEVLS